MMRESGPTQWSGWSEWIWNEQYQRYYRQRQNNDGHVDFEWEDTGARTNAEQTPRESDLDSLAQTFQETHLQSPSSTANYDHSTAEYTIASGSSKHRSKTSSKGKSKASKSSSSRSKGKAPAAHYDDEDTEQAWQGISSRRPASDAQPQHYYDHATQQYYEYPQAPRQPDAGGHDAPVDEETLHDTSSRQSRPDEHPQHYYDPATRQYYDYPPTSRQPPTPAYPDTASGTQQYYDYPRSSRQSAASTYSETAPPSNPTAGQYSEDYDEEEDPMVAAAIKDSRRYNYGASTPGESSTTAYGYDDYEDEGPPTPKAGMSDSHISATGGQMEELDPRYRVEPSHKFQPGEIFKVLWSEPQGSGNEGTPSISERFEVRDRFGGRIFVGFRRFIVIANDQGHCTCVPILTYGGKACNKRGIKPEKHGIVYEKGHRARLLAGEPKLGFAPVKIQMSGDGEKLSKESRVNYSKLVTVEHNVKVLFVGRIVAADWDIVSEAVNRCWEDKIHHSRKHFDRFG